MTEGRNKSHLEATRTRSNAGWLVKLSGIIDETFDSATFRDLAGVVVLDLGSVHRITSYGVREWTRALGSLSASSIWFVRCRPPIVSQLNMVNGFAGRGKLLTFFAPYVCPSCHSNQEQLVDLRTDAEAIKAFEPPEVTCKQCGEQAEFDDLPDSYFEFAAGQGPLEPPAELEALLSGQLPFRVLKEVEGDVTLLALSGALDVSSRFKRLADGLEGEVVFFFDQLTMVTAEGKALFLKFLGELPLPVSLLRVPLDLALEVQADPSAKAIARLVSVYLPFECRHCAAQARLELSQAVRLSSRECPSCGTSTVGFNAEDLAAVAKLAFHVPSAKVSSAVEAHREHRAGATGSQTSPGPGDGSEETFGRYRIIRPLGVGGMAEVYLARQTSVGNFQKTIVIKRILPHMSKSPAFVEMFLQEARLAAHISHPNVVQIFDVGQVGDQYFIAMEFVRGWDLQAILRLTHERKMQMPIELVVQLGASLCAGLHAAHTSVDAEGTPLGIVHRDVSPQNVLVSTDGVVKITDFGIAKAVGGGDETPTDTIKGKLAYVAPEQLSGGGTKMDARVDVFAAGLVIFQCLTLQNLFRRNSEAATLKAVLQDRIPRASELRPEVPDALSQVLSEALSREPRQRYQTARKFEQALLAVAATLKPVSNESLALWLKTVADTVTQPLDSNETKAPTSFDLTPVTLVKNDASTGTKE